MINKKMQIAITIGVGLLLSGCLAGTNSATPTTNSSGGAANTNNISARVGASSFNATAPESAPGTSIPGVYSMAAGGTVLAGTWSGQAMSFDGSNWDVYGQTLNSPILTVATSSQYGEVAGTMAGNVYQYNSSQWESRPGSGSSGTLDNSMITSIAIAGNGTIYAATEKGNVYDYSNGSWELAGSPGNGNWISALVVSPSGAVYAETPISVWQYFPESTGQWTQVAQTSTPDNGPLLSMAVTDASGTDIVYVGTAFGYVYSANAVPGSSWAQVATYLGKYGAVNTMALSQQAPFTLYIGTYDGRLLQSTNGGSWNTTATLDGSSVLQIALSESGTLYASTDAGYAYNLALPPPSVPTINFIFQYNNFNIVGTPVSQTYFWIGNLDARNPISQSWSVQFFPARVYYIGLSINPPPEQHLSFNCSNNFSNNIAIDTSQIGPTNVATVTVDFTSFVFNSAQLSCTCSSIPAGVCTTLN